MIVQASVHYYLHCQTWMNRQLYYYTTIRYTQMHIQAKNFGEAIDTSVPFAPNLGWTIPMPLGSSSLCKTSCSKFGVDHSNECPWDQVPCAKLVESRWCRCTFKCTDVRNNNKSNWKDVLTMSINSRRPSVRKRLVTPLFWNDFSAITSLFFVIRSKRIAFLESVNFSPQTSKRHTFRVSAFHRYHWFGIKLFLVGCVQDSWRVP